VEIVVYSGRAPTTGRKRACRRVEGGGNKRFERGGELTDAGPAARLRLREKRRGLSGLE